MFVNSLLHHRCNRLFTFSLPVNTWIHFFSCRIYATAFLWISDRRLPDPTMSRHRATGLWILNQPKKSGKQVTIAQIARVVRVTGLPRSLISRLMIGSNIGIWYRVVHKKKVPYQFSINFFSFYRPPCISHYNFLQQIGRGKHAGRTARATIAVRT